MRDWHRDFMELVRACEAAGYEVGESNDGAYQLLPVPPHRLAETIARAAKRELYDYSVVQFVR